jgi:hypothetical protein
MAAPDLPAFDPAIIERYVENTYRKASAVFIGSVVAGVMIGAAFGATPLTSLGASWPIPKMFGFATMLVGAIVGGVIGYIVGDTRAFLCRLQAQTALCQVQTERHASATLRTLQAIAATRGPHAATPPAAAELAVGRPQPQDADLTGPLILLALALLGLAAAGGSAIYARRTGHLAGWGHAWREAGYRATGAWGDFSDWLRLGR